MVKRPRRLILMVKAGDVVDGFIEQLVPLLDKGDVIVDGGNSYFGDSDRRCEALKAKGILFVGTGISGGEEGARHGPSIMPGGNPEGWPHVKEIFQSIAAKADGGEPCCDWVGEQGAGHYVKMVHNGIEYGDMQLICESYDIMKRGLGMSAEEIADTFSKWNKGVLDSYLIEITSKIFRVKDSDGTPLVDKILDAAGQKGTGKWTAINALDLGMPLTLIGEAVFARNLSSLVTERVQAASLFGEAITPMKTDKSTLLSYLEWALYASKVVSYAQGFMLMKAAAKEYKWHLHFGNVALMWRGGCIIRSAFLGKIKEAFDANPNLENLLLAPYFVQQVTKAAKGWRETVSAASLAGIPLPTMSSALSFYDGLRSSMLPANLLQAQRDFFGAHTYERKDSARGKFFHTNWG